MATIRWTLQDCVVLGHPHAPALGGRLEVIVVHTSILPTLQALKTAATLAKGLSARIRLLVPQVVPYALPLDCPPVPSSFTERRFRTIAEEVGVETSVEIIYCRDLASTLGALLRPHSLVVLGSHRPRAWRLPWRGGERVLARRLRGLGHQVVLAESL